MILKIYKLQIVTQNSQALVIILLRRIRPSKLVSIVWSVERKKMKKQKLAKKHANFQQAQILFFIFEPHL